MSSEAAKPSGLGPEESLGDVRGSENDVCEARLLRASTCSLWSGWTLEAREESKTLRSPGLQLAREHSDAVHRSRQESPDCLRSDLILVTPEGEAGLAALFDR